MSIRSYSQRQLQTIAPDATAREAARRMEEANVGCLIVTQNGKPEALVTDRDIALRVLCDQLDPGSVLVRDLAHDELVTLSADASIQEAVETLRTHRVRRLPIVDTDGSLVGLVTQDDLMMLFASELAILSDAIQGQLPREASA